jgi:hypothetical protein
LVDRVLDGMAHVPRDAGLAHLIAPVRPGFKHRCPIIPIERCVTLTRENGEPFDPWIRVHVRRGARIAKPIPPLVADHRHGRRVGEVDVHALPR